MHSAIRRRRVGVAREPPIAVLSGVVLHFTQLLWVATTNVGCGVACSADNTAYVVCEYSPPGNWQGEFPANVLPCANGASTC
jgi:hypothetical protein